MRSLIIFLCLAVSLSACDGVNRAPARPFAEVGTRALIKSSGREFTAEVVRVDHKLVTVEFRRAGSRSGEPLVSYDYYRGLFPVSGMDNGQRFELDYVEADIEPFFPLKVGKSISFSASMQFIDTGQSRPMMADLKVVGKKSITLESGPEDVFVIAIENRLMDGSEVQSQQKQIVYFAPDLSMVLKNVRKDNDQEFFWRVISIERANSANPRPRRRGGTVAI